MQWKYVCEQVCFTFKGQSTAPFNVLQPCLSELAPEKSFEITYIFLLHLKSNNFMRNNDNFKRSVSSWNFQLFYSNFNFRMDFRFHCRTKRKRINNKKIWYWCRNGYLNQRSQKKTFDESKDGKKSLKIP